MIFEKENPFLMFHSYVQMGQGMFYTKHANTGC